MSLIKASFCKGVKVSKNTGVSEKIKKMASTVRMVVAAVALPIGIPCLCKNQTCAKPPPVAIGVIFEKKILMNTSLVIALLGIL